MMLFPKLVNDQVRYLRCCSLSSYLQGLNLNYFKAFQTQAISQSVSDMKIYKFNRLIIIMMNSNDIFNQIGLILNPQQDITFLHQNKYVACLQIEIGDDQIHLLQVKDSDNPHKLAKQFCKQHRLNHLAVNIVEQKIQEAKEREEAKLMKSKSKNKVIKKQKQRENKENITKYSPSKSITPSKSQNNLYLRNIVRSRINDQERRKRKQEQEKKEQEELTFKPKINHVSEKIVEFLRTQKMPKKSKKQSPPKKMYEEMKDCTFHPKINKVSNMIVNNRSLRREEIQNFNQVYGNRDGTNSKSKKKNTKQDVQYFKPKINEKSSQKIKVPFFKRLQMEMARKKSSNKSFYGSQECSFHPKIGRPPKKIRKKQNEPIWEHLHEFNSKKQIKKHLCSVNTITADHIKTQNHQNYYENLIEGRVKDVFSLLDNNEDGLISPEEIGIQNLSPNSLIFLKPIFMEMDELNATLNYYEFYKAVKALLCDTDPSTKGAFLSQKWWKGNQDEDNFIPQINPKSKEIAANRTGSDLYEDGIREMYNKQYRLEKERALKEQKELAECSFKPSLNHSSKYYINRILSKKDLKNKSAFQLFDQSI